MRQLSKYTRLPGIDPGDQLESMIARLRYLRAARNQIAAEICEGRLRSPAWMERMVRHYDCLNEEIRAIQGGSTGR